jgi:hypothetical protein
MANVTFSKKTDPNTRAMAAVDWHFRVGLARC